MRSWCPSVNCAFDTHACTSSGPSREFVTCPASAAGASLVTPQNDAAHVRHVVPHAPLALNLSHLKRSTVTPGPRPQRLGAFWASTAFKSSAASPRGLESSSAGANVTHWFEERVIAPHAVVNSRLAFHIIVLTLKTIEKEESSTSSESRVPIIFNCLRVFFLTERLNQSCVIAGANGSDGHTLGNMWELSGGRNERIVPRRRSPPQCLRALTGTASTQTVSLSQPPLESSALSHMAITLGNFGG
ncbi:hypothetical protein B0H13DRAFT_1915825 [Mycena leptocephala]|nr:hypothetical protein B0H13DRAFT_1915825 [Mycena leptocephala]